MFALVIIIIIIIIACLFYAYVAKPWLFCTWCAVIAAPVNTVEYVMSQVSFLNPSGLVSKQIKE